MSAPVPPAVRSADEVLPLARALIDADGERLAQDTEISCRAGCSACCSQAVPVRPAEVRAIRGHLEQLPAEERADIGGRIAAARDRLVAAGVTGPPASDEERAGMIRRYFEAGVACPLLSEDGVCGVRPVRPLACREYFVTSDPAHCATFGGPIVRIRSSRDVLNGFGKVSRALGEPEVGWLTFALAADAPDHAPDHPPVSGVQVTQVLSGQRL